MRRQLRQASLTLKRRRPGAMKTEDFANATETQLRQKANEYFDSLETSGSHEKPALLIGAQFYMDEIERRKQGRVAARDLILELVVILLIALEIYFGVTGGNQQLAVLQKLNASTGATAEVLSKLADQQKAALSGQKDTLRTIEQVNTTLQNELKLLSAQQERQLRGSKVTGR